MNKREAWQRIPSLVRRYGPGAARAVCDVVGSVGESALLDLVIQADACALYGNPQEAARLYVRASQVVEKDVCLRQVSALLESAIYCDPSHVETRIKLIQALHTGCSFWRAGEHLKLLTDFDCSHITLQRWVAFLSELSIEPRMQAGLLQCCIWLTEHFTRVADQKQILEMALALVQSAQDAWSVCWQEYVRAAMKDQYHDMAFLSHLIQSEDIS